MKVVHVIKRVETIDNDIKELRKLEKSITRNKSFSTPIYMTIEKQINILLGERIKLLELKIANPPAEFSNDVEGEKDDIQEEPVFQTIPEPKKVIKPKAAPKAKKAEPKPKTEAPVKSASFLDDLDDIPMLTQDQIDAKFSSLSEEKAEAKTEPVKAPVEIEDFQENTKKVVNDDGIKLLDVALEKGTLNRKVLEKEKKVRFFRENFPSD